VLGTWEGDVESVVRTVKSERGLIRTKHKVVEAKGKDKGVLVLTNERLVWLNKKGVFSKSYHMALEIPLQNVAGISETGRITKRICISDRDGEYRFRLSVALDEFRGLFEKALAERKAQLERMKKKERVHVMIDFSFIKDYMKEGGLSLKTMKCPECNAPIKMPKEGTEIICQYCNNPIHAQDIFEKIKSLIG
jgi:NADH pyrophosphatase NudC (nudix superfamily)